MLLEFRRRNVICNRIYYKILFCTSLFAKLFLHAHPLFVPSPVAVSVRAARLVVPDRFGNAEVEQSDSEARGEQHREVGDVSELWLLVRLTELQLGVLREKQINDEQYPRILGTNVEPSPRIRHPSFRVAQLCFGHIRLHDAPDHEAPDDHRRQKRHYRVYVKLQRSPASFERDALGALVVLLVLSRHPGLPLLRQLIDLYYCGKKFKPA